VDGLPSTYKPYIQGKVLKPTNVLIRAYIICDSNGVSAVSNSTINDWIAEANRIYRQVAVTFTLASVSSITNQIWFDVENAEEFYQMTSYTNLTGGIELYCVSDITGANGMHSDLRLSYGDSRRGLAVKAEATPQTLAHEIGHTCGLFDMYDYDPGDGLVSEDKTYPQNWSGGTDTGYHPPSLVYRDLTYRVLMSAPQETTTRGDIPLYYLTGLLNTNRIPASVGLNQMYLNELKH
jgi:hypothetical protein